MSPELKDALRPLLKRAWEAGVAHGRAHQFSSDAAERFTTYFAADDDGYYPGDMHAQFGLNVQTFADRSHLVRKQITRSDGHRTWVWVNPDKGKHAGKGDTPKKKGADHNPTLDAETAVSHAINAPHELSADHVERLAEHLETLPRDRLKEIAKGVRAKVGGLKMDLVNRLLAHVGAQANPDAAPGGAIARGDAVTRRWKLDAPPEKPKVGQWDAWKKPGESPKDSAPNLPTTVDKPTTVGNNTPVPATPAGGTNGGETMDERTQKIAARLQGQYPALPPERVAALAATVKPGEGGVPNDAASHAAASKQAASEHAESLYPTPAMPALTGASDAQASFADATRQKFVTAIRNKLVALEVNAAARRGDGGDDSSVAAQQKQLASWLDRISRVTSAKKILDAKDTDFTNISANVADIVAKKLGVSL